MKIIKSILLCLTIIIVVLACQKELSYDNNGASIGSFVKDSYGNCNPANVTGIFSKDSVLTNNNFVDVQVNVTAPGTFSILSDTVNGYFFSKSGSVVVGTNTIRLYPTGKPLIAGTNNFTIKYGTSTCVFAIVVTDANATPAVFTLGTTAGACTGAVANGTLNKDSVLTAANTLTVQVNVTTTGTYTLSATTTNGFTYLGAGVFTKTGAQTVTLVGSGKPATAGNTVVTVINGTSSCTISVTVNGTNGGTAAVFTLNGAPNTCTNFIVSGNYTAGTPTNIGDSVTLGVNVTTAGTYTLSTNTSDGFSFTKTGTFTNTGAQNIVLAATGTPTNSGTFTFAPSITNTCSFTVNVNPATVVNTDYFPLTKNSFWSYTIQGYTDTVSNFVFGTNQYNGGKTYTEMEDDVAGVAADTAHYRKSVNDYYEWSPTDYFSFFVQFDSSLPKTYADINFLKENAVNNTSWSQNFSGTLDVASGTKGTVTYNFKILNADTSISMNGINYPHVIYMSNAVNWNVPSYALNTVIENDYFYYAKGVGLIKILYVPTPTAVAAGATQWEFDIKNYKVY